MQRRDFLQTSLAATAASAAACGLASAAPASSLADLDYYEWRTYRIADARQQSLVLEYLEAALVPAWNRAKVGPIGVFTEIGDTATLDVHALLTYRGSFGMSRIQIWHDDLYQQAAEKYFAVKPDAPGFQSD